MDEKSKYTTFDDGLRKQVMCPASAKAVNVLAVRHVKKGTESIGFRPGSIFYTHVFMFV